MRDIKFKFYLKETSSKLIFSKIFDYAAIFSGTAKRFFNEQHPDSFIIAKEQFTGLKDKNKKEIYEGDIVKSKGKNWPVIYKNDRHHVGYLGGTNSQYIHLWYDDVEIIGNIHQNKELIES